MSKKIKVITSRIMTHADMQDLNRAYKYKKIGHSYSLLKHVGKQYCVKCGLMRLNNKISQWCADKGCNYKDHMQYKRTLYRLTKLRG